MSKIINEQVKEMDSISDEQLMSYREPLSEELVLAAAMRLVSRLEGSVLSTLKPFDITPQQYNVLRILRGAGTEGLSCMEIGKRMITRLPDVPRLIDRLVSMELAKRQKSKSDGRVSLISITPKGRRLLLKIDEPVIEMNRQELGHLSEQELHQLRDLLIKARRED